MDAVLGEVRRQVADLFDVPGEALELLLRRGGVFVPFRAAPGPADEEPAAVELDDLRRRAVDMLSPALDGDRLVVPFVSGDGAVGLLDRLAAVVISEEAGVSKPDPAIFALAAERAGTTLDGAWMVGDNLDADIAGARAAGIRSVFVPRVHEWLTFTSGTEPDLVADDVAAAIRLVLIS